MTALDTASASEWELDQLDLGAYLRRLGVDSPRGPTPRVLHLLHRAHAAAIPFENLDILLGRPIRLDLAAIQDKLVQRPRGGYCYEHNLLFAALLERLGFAVTRLAARVRMGSTSIRPRTHMVLRVEAADTPWLADVGFGGEGLIDPLPLVDGAVTSVPGWNHELEREEGGEWVLRSLHPDEWFDLYAFSLEPQHHVDYEVANHYVSTFPRSPFVTQLVVQRSAPDLRLTLTGRRLVETHPDGTESAEDVGDAALPEVLRERFGIALDGEEVERLRAVGGGPSTDQGRIDDQPG